MVVHTWVVEAVVVQDIPLEEEEVVDIDMDSAGQGMVVSEVVREVVEEGLPGRVANQTVVAVVMK